MSESLKFFGGDELIETFLLEHTNGEIVDLTGLSVSGVVLWRRLNRIPLSVGAELTIVTLYPTRAVDPEDQVPHGYFRLTELQTDLIPYGATAGLRLTVIEGGVTMSTYPFLMERVF